MSKTENNGSFFNRELSWVEFNRRVLDEGLQGPLPLLERLKYLSIVSSNFDEFFMVRVATLKTQKAKGDKVRCPTGMSPSAQLKEVRKQVRDIIDKQYACYNDEIVPGLKKKGFNILHPSEYTDSQLSYARDYFNKELFPQLTPIRLDMDGEFPYTGPPIINIAFRLQALSEEHILTTSPETQDSKEGKGEPGQKELYATISIPSSLDRFIGLPDEDGSSSFGLLEDVIRINAETLFSGFRIIDSVYFRITRDADMAVDEERDEDFMAAMEEILIDRQHSKPVRLELSEGSEDLGNRIIGLLKLKNEDVFNIPGPLNLKDFMKLSFMPSFEKLRYKDWGNFNPVPEDKDIWEVVKENDIFLHHPFDSFSPVVRMVTEAADDPSVLSLRMILYRTSGNSPIVQALGKAAEKGKQVMVFVELKARFDEMQNIGWAQELERRGAIVIYGIARLKVHAKAMLIIRREADGIRKYVHLGTGNYHDKTAKLYTDMSVLSAREEYSSEISMFFNAITGYSSVANMNTLVMAPFFLKDRIVSLIDREAERSTPEDPGQIMAKMNSLAHPDVIAALYRASRAGVKILLNVRGICMLRPGVEGQSENITVVSIIDRYLEHSRVFYFRNRGDEEVYMSSADWMPRNLDRRVELMFPVLDKKIRKEVRKALKVFFSDNTKAHVLKNDGSYMRLAPKLDEKEKRAQEIFYREAMERKEASQKLKRELTVRKKP